MSDTLWLVVNTLESIQIVSTEDNLSKMLASISTLKKLAQEASSPAKEDEVDG